MSLEIKHWKVNNLADSIIMAGLPMRIDNMDNLSNEVLAVELALLNKDYNSIPKLKTFKALANTPQASGHSCALKGVDVLLVIESGSKFFRQLSRYHFQDTISSSSTMHKILKVDLDNVLPNSIYESTKLNLKQDIDLLNELSHKLKHCDKCDEQLVREQYSLVFERLTDNIPSGYKYTRAIRTNYLQLRNIIAQRTGHKLNDWNIFIEWIYENLPLAKELLSPKEQ
jgi:hypothetical protein